LYENKNSDSKISNSEQKNSNQNLSESIEITQLSKLENELDTSRKSLKLNQTQEKANLFTQENTLFQLQEKASPQLSNGNYFNSIIQKKALPDNLQKGAENLSGQSMDDVNVHYNSDKPKELGAHAYAQGTDIHLGQGQEKHLAHEAWHVVQQKEGRVKPTIQKKNKTPINDDASLEKEADVMGEKALALGEQISDDTPTVSEVVHQDSIQRAVEDESEQEEQELESAEAENDSDKQVNASDDNAEAEENQDQDSSAQIDIKPETLVLSGTKSLYAKISSFFGKETSFGELQNLVKEYETIEDDAQKEEHSKKIVQACNKWLKKHPKPKKSKSLFGRLKSGFNKVKGKTENDNKKRDSITLIRSRFLNAEKASDIKLTTLSDKQSLTSKMKGVFGFKTTFKQVEDQYHQYQNEASSISSFSTLLQVLGKAKDIFKLIDQWKHNHTDMEDSKEKAKRDSLNKIESGILNLFFQANYKNIISIKVSKLSLAELKKDKIALEALELTINIEGKKLVGKGENIVVTSSGVDFSKLTIDYNDSLKISEGFEVSKPKLMVSHQDENYSITASGDLNLSMDIPNVSLSAEGGVEVNYNTQNSEFTSPKLSNAKIEASLFDDNLKIGASDIDYAGGVFKAKNGAIALKNFDLSSEVSDLKFSKKDGFDWSKIEITIDKEINVGDVIRLKSPKAAIQGKSNNYAYDISGNLGINAPLPEGFNLEASGDVSVSGNPGEKNYDVSLNGNGEINLSVGKIIKANAKQINYDKSKGELTAGTASLTLNLHQNSKTAELKSLSVSKNEGVDWELATFKFEKLGLDGFVAVNDVVATVKGKKDNYEKHAEGTLDIESSVPGANINAEGIRVGMNVKDGKWSFDLKGEQISVGLLEDRLMLTSSKLKYENKKFEMDTLAVSLALPTGGAISAKGSGVVIEKNKVDWNEIRFPIPKILPNIGSLKLGNGDGILKGKNEKYALGLDVEAAIKKGDWFEASGKASLLWNHKEKKSPEITEYQMNFDVQSPTVPDAFMPPGTWPINFSLVMPFAAGPVPMEAEVEFGAKAGARLGIKGTVAKIGNTTSISGIGNGTAGLGVWIKGSVGVGSKYLLKLAGFLKGDASANANVNLNLEGGLDDKFNFTSLIGNYIIDAKFIAQLSAGIEAKALVIFQKTLYEVSLKKWELGSSQKKGSYDFLKNENQDKGTNGLFKGKDISKEDINDPPELEHNSKEYLQAMEKFNQILKADNPNQKTKDSPDEDGIFDSNKINTKKGELIEILNNVIEENLSNKEFIKFQKKIEKDNIKLIAKKEKHRVQMDRQHEKLKDAKEGKLGFYKSRLKGRDSNHYIKKIERLEKKYRDVVEKDLDKLKIHLDKKSIYQNQINTATTYLASIDKILANPDLGLSEIDQEIAEYHDLSKKGDEQRYSIENYLIDDDFANIDIDYDNE